MSNNNRPNSVANLARQVGAPIPPLEQKTFNPLGKIKVDKTKFSKLWQIYDMNQNCNFLKWSNLPNGLTSWNLNRMLYFRGSLVGFKYGGNVYVLPYTNFGRINPYGLPTEVRPITYNGQAVDDNPQFFSKKFKLSVDVTGNETEYNENSAFILYDSVPMSANCKSPARVNINKIIIDEIAEVLAKININVKVSAKKIYFMVKDPKQADVIRQELAQAFDNDCPFEVLTDEMQTSTIQNSDDFMATEYFNIIKNWDSVRCFMSGIKAKIFGEEKKERLITDELAGTNEQVDLIADMRLTLAKEWAEKMNKAHGTNIQVEYNQKEEQREVIEYDEGDEQ